MVQFRSSRAQQLVHPLHGLLLSIVPGVTVSIRSGLEVGLADDALNRLYGCPRRRSAWWRSCAGNDMEKFKEAISGHYSRFSITQSKSRINRAIKWFTNHIEDPSWQPPETARRIKTRKTASENSEDDREMYDFLVPLNDSKTVARLHMPCSLSKNDADCSETPATETEARTQVSGGKSIST